MEIAFKTYSFGISDQFSSGGKVAQRQPRKCVYSMKKMLKSWNISIIKNAIVPTLHSASNVSFHRARWRKINKLFSKKDKQMALNTLIEQTRGARFKSFQPLRCVRNCFIGALRIIKTTTKKKNSKSKKKKLSPTRWLKKKRILY